MDCEKYMNTISIIHRFAISQHIKAMESCKISGYQLGYIIYISRCPGSSQEDLAEFFKVNKGTVAKGLKKLLNEGYILRRHNEDDRRAYKLFLTDKGSDILKEARLSMLRFNETLTRGMTDEEKAAFDDLLLRARNNILDAAGEEREALLRPPTEKDCRKPKK